MISPVSLQSDRANSASRGPLLQRLLAIEPGPMDGLRTSLPQLDPTPTQPSQTKRVNNAGPNVMSSIERNAMTLDAVNIPGFNSEYRT